MHQTEKQKHDAEVDGEARRLSFAQADQLARHLAHTFAAQPVAHAHERDSGVHHGTWHALTEGDHAGHTELARRIRALLALDIPAVQSDIRFAILQRFGEIHHAAISATLPPEEQVDPIASLTFVEVEGKLRLHGRRSFVDDPGHKDWPALLDDTEANRTELFRRAAAIARHPDPAILMGDALRHAVEWCRRENGGVL